MLPSALLMHRYQGTDVVPKRLPLSTKTLDTAREIIDIFQSCVGQTRGDLDEQLQILEGHETDYRVKRGFAHLLSSGFADFEVVSPLEPDVLRRLVFAAAAPRRPGPAAREEVLTELATRLTHDLGRAVTPAHIEAGLYADLKQNERLTSFDAPDAEALVHRYNLSQVQGVLYRASEIVITAYRNDPGEYKQLFKFLKLFGLISYIEGDADHGFTITIDGPASLFKQSTRYGTDLAKFLPALLHVSRWKMEASILPRANDYGPTPNEAQLTLDSECGLVSHYKKGATYDSAVEEAFAARWAKTDTDWRLEREVDLIPIPGSVMIPDFRLVHPDRDPYLLEIVGYWRPAYLQKKFAQVRKAERSDLILAVSERLNLGKAGVTTEGLPAKVVWYKGKVNPKDVLAAVA